MEQRVEDELVITSFTDPVCTWCWGTEPVFRRLETRFPGKVVTRYVMGGLVKGAHDYGRRRRAYMSRSRGSAIIGA